jgi:hypothetical protein
MHLFGEVADGEVRLSKLGLVVSEEWQRSAAIREELEMGPFVVMPNHIHGM